MQTPKSKDFDQEKAYLAETVAFIENEMTKISSRLSNTKSQIIHRRKEMNDHEGWMLNTDDANAVDNAQDLTTLRLEEKRYNQHENQLKRYGYLKARPYFGKIVVEDEELYIGTQTVTDDDYNVLICDWRAPIASLFYENQLGMLSYQTDDGRTIKENVLGRRQFQIDQGTLINFFDSDTFIGDTYLLKEGMTHTKGKLGNIVGTIQKDQNEIIRLPINQDVFVLGPPGSGKTAIAMQRIAYLLFKYKATVSHENLMLVAPNGIFSDYVSDVLPELGEQNIKVQSLVGMIRKIRFFKRVTCESKVAMITRVNEDTHARTVFYKKSGEAFQHFMLQQLEQGQCTIYFKDIRDARGHMMFSKKMLREKFEMFKASYDIPTAIQKLKQTLIDTYKATYKQLFEQRYHDLVDDDKYLGEDAELIAQAKSQTSKVLKQAKRMIKSYRFIDIERTYKTLCASFGTAYNATTPILYEDFWAQVWLYTVLVNETDASFKHILVDEVQDYSILQLDIMQRLNGDAHFTF